MTQYFTKKTVYIGLFAILYLIVAFSSFWHAIAFFGLANNSWMSIILAFAFEVGQAAVLFSLLTSQKDRSRIMPWVLMFMFTLVQVIGNVFSSYKYLISNSVENLRYFKEPIFIWTDLPDDQTTVIITYIVGAILPVAALLLTSMITNYLNDTEEETRVIKVNEVDKENPVINQVGILEMKNQGLKEQLQKLQEQIKSSNDHGPSAPIELKNEQEFIDLYNGGKEPRIDTEESKFNNDNGEQPVDNIKSKENTESTITEDSKREDNEISTEGDDGDKQLENELNEEENIHQPSVEVKEEVKTPSHFVNLK